MTHEVFNQPPPFEDVNLFASDPVLVEGVRREGATWAEERLSRFGEIMGRAEMLEAGNEANRHSPELRTHDRFGNRIDEVAYHPAYHEVMRVVMEHQLHCLPWIERRAGAHVARNAMTSIHAQVEAGSGCPITMTFACVPSLRA